MKIRFCCLYLFLAVTTSQTEGDICVKDAFDYIVVGLGSAGSAITGRLSEDGKVKVLALEAGKEPEAFSKIPYFAKFMPISHMTYQFFTTKQECCKVFDYQKPAFVQGKVLGGSSAVNGLQYTRGCKRDYENWFEQGNEGWAYKDVLPYFLKLEDYRVPHSPCDADYHSKNGPISVESPKAKTFMADAFIEGAFQLGYPKIDLLGASVMGFTNGVSNLRDGARCSAYTGYIEPALSRTNMRVEAEAVVTKILVDGGLRVTGVTYMKNGQYCNVTANKEVIISAGVINTPKLLMLSGIGPKDAIEKHKIPLVLDAPGVGQNLHDHCSVLTFISLNQSLPYANLLNVYDNFNLWIKSRTGIMTNAFGSEGMGLFSSGLNSHPEDWPDLEFYLMSDDLSVITLHPNFNKTVSNVLVPKVPNKVTIMVSLQRPQSRGYVTLLSDRFDHPPIVNPRYLAEDVDLTVLGKGIEKLHELVNTKAMQQYGAKIAEKVSPDCDSKSQSKDEYFKCVAMSLSIPTYHGGGTCKMGPKTDPLAVVDDRLRIHGLTGIRVADSSIMPAVPVAHINAPCMMIGEKAADMIKEDNK